MQATVHRFDPNTFSGAVVTDDGVLLPLDRTVVESSALRTLRVGQRLTIDVEGRGRDARVSRIALESVGHVPSRPSRP
jgi:2-phospho-L-lactate guanylyltransferase